MSDAANQTTRVILLLLATGGFAAVWSGDRRPSAATGTGDSQAAAVTRHQAFKADVGSAFCRPEFRGGTAAAERRAAYERPQTTGPVDRDVPLPHELTPGEYRVVNGRGDVRSMVFTPRDLAYRDIRTACIPRELYRVEVGGERWYFIRIGGVGDSSTVTENSPAEAAPAGESALFSWHADTESICPKSPARLDAAPYWEIVRKLADWILPEVPARPRDARRAAKNGARGYLFMRPFEGRPEDRLRLSGR